MNIYPSLPSGNLLNLENSIKKLESQVPGFHIDIMDFHFVPNITFGPAFVNQIRKNTNKELWIHAMVDKPLELIRMLKLHQSDRLSIHIETLKEPNMLEEAKKLYPRIGLAINPQTHLGELLPFINIIDHILVMSVEPGFSSQEFLDSTWPRLEEVKKLKQTHPDLIIKVDGGVNQNNIKRISAYADAVAVSSGIFHNANLVENLARLQ
jgi:ribulose-phosphate 3-epimerase